MKIKLKTLLTLATAVFLLVCMATVAFAQGDEAAQSHSALVCGECGKEVVKCNDTIINCDQYHCPDSLCPYFESHMKSTIFIIALITLLGIAVMTWSIYGIIRSAIEKKVSISYIVALITITIVMIVYTAIETVPELPRAIEFLLSH